jgi:hypothetical protein
LIEKMYQDHQRHVINRVDVFSFQQPVANGIERYKKQFPNDCKHVEDITLFELHELQRYFSFNYSDWSNENSYLPSMLVKFEDPSKNYRTSVSRTSTKQGLRDAFIGVSFGEDPAKVIDIEFTPATY